MAAIDDIFQQIGAELQNAETRTTWLWYCVITLTGMFNLYQLAKLLCCPAYRPINPSPRQRAYEKWMKVVATCFIIACSLRSFFPVVYAHRQCFFSFQIPGVNRALAFVAEVSLPVGVSAAFKFISKSLKDWRFCTYSKTDSDSDRVMVERLKLAAHTDEMGWLTGSVFKLAETFLDFSVVLILFANTCCNLGTISKNHWWFVVEESCWGIYFLGITFILCFAYWQLQKAVPSDEEEKLSTPARADLTVLKWLFLFVLAISVGGSLLILLHDIPKLRALALEDCDRILCPEMLSIDFREGLQDTLRCYVVRRDWELWKYSAAWQTPYFTFGVWAVIAFSSCPGTDIFRTKVVS